MKAVASAVALVLGLLPFALAQEEHAHSASGSVACQTHGDHT